MRRLYYARVIMTDKSLSARLADFAKFKTIIESVAIVPVGITKFHQNGLKTLTIAALHV